MVALLATYSNILVPVGKEIILKEESAFIVTPSLLADAGISKVYDPTSLLSKQEHNVPSKKLVAYRLAEASPDQPILNQLKADFEVYLAHFFAVLAGHQKGETGFLIDNGYANVCYIRDQSGKRSAVVASRDLATASWSISVFPIGSYKEWWKDRQVIASRDY